MASHTPAVQLQVLAASDRNPTTAPFTASSKGPRDADRSSSETLGHKAVLSRGRTVIVVTQLVGVQLFTSFCNGIVVIGLPAISTALHIEAGLLLWPTSVFYLTAGSCLMLAGSIADVIGSRITIMAASFLLVATAIGCGLSKTGGALIAFRALQGVVNAMVVPASVSIVSTSVEFGRPRNLSFACLGFSGPLGFLLGLVLGGVMIDRVGFRPAFYLAAGVSFVLGVCGLWVLPTDSQAKTSWSTLGKRLVYDLDWVGTLIASAGLAMVSYVLAMLSADIHNIRKAPQIVLLIIGLLSAPAFAYWMHFRVKHNRPALIPNHVWQNATFTSICIMILFISAVSNSMELYSSLFFQEVQGTSALGASLRILPALVTAVVINVSTGFFVDRMPVVSVVLLAAVLSAISPLLMAVIDPDWPYWYMAFIAQVLQPICPDVLFTVGILIISAVFPAKTQALGGAVFNTCSQLGTSIGLTITSVISDSMTAKSGYTDKSSPAALLEGYRATFWALFAWTVVVVLVGAGGLRKLGKIGMKHE
ncbi:hypothetical protein J1614_005710 [Plenodomus biglobosus]|nr:hypothetical protein J1614_005710 [Plenodomus biglobosus]